jgi:signal transduction histidine kinase
LQEILNKLDTDDKSLLALLIVFITIVMLAVVFLIAMFRYYKSMRDKQEELFKASLKAQEEERGRIAEDLHDDIGPRLSALKLSIDLMRNDFEVTDRIKMIDETTEILDFVIKDIRVIVRNLAAKYISEKGIYLQLHEFKKQIEKGGTFKIDLEIECFKEHLDPDFAINLYRVIQELINNSVKHSQSSRIDIIAERTPNNLSLIYKDNGIGFNEAMVNKGLGLNNIITRIKLYKGQCVINSKPDKGTCYTINFDMKNIIETKTTEVKR